METKNTPHAAASGTFNMTIWNHQVQAIADSFRFSSTERSHFRASRTAMLIGALPWIAGCDQAERTALSHLATYQLSIKESTRRVYDHDPADNGVLLNRLHCIMNFKGGNPDLIARGMNLLALQMICGYNRDLAKDTVSGEYNPLLSRAWHGEELIESLIEDIRSVQCPIMDMIMTIEEAQNQWWN